MTVAYDGTDYSGYQIQNNAPTIEGTLKEAILQVTGEDVTLIGGSRTDAGVHARCNIAVFDTGSPIPGEKFYYALNSKLPPEIRVVNSAEVEADFHPRHCDSRKTYEYHIDRGPIPDPLYQRYRTHIYWDLDVEGMKRAAEHFMGEHDFASFCSAGGQTETTIRTIYNCEVIEEGRHIIIRVQGNGFLYNMVRIIAGTLLEVGSGRIAPEDIPGIINACDRQAAGPTAPAKGLVLEKYEFASFRPAAGDTERHAFGLKGSLASLPYEDR